MTVSLVFSVDVKRLSTMFTYFTERPDPSLRFLCVDVKHHVPLTVDDDDELMLNVLRCQLTY